MAKSRVKVRDLGYASVLKELKATEGVHITVGVHGDQKPRSGGTPMTLVAAANEFGTTDGRVPERSFIRATVDSRRNDIAEVMQKQMKLLEDGKRSAKDVAEIVGLWTANAIKKYMTDLQEPPNAPSTVARKGSSNPLIDTGQLRSAVTHKVVIGKKPPKGSV